MSTPNATTGAPEFSESDAPQFGADLTEVAAWAALVGTRPIGTTTERSAFDSDGYSREGMRWYDTTLDREFLHTGSGWVDLGPTDSGWTNISSFQASITAVSGQTPRVRRVGNKVDVFGAVAVGGSWTPQNLFTVPTAMRITSSSGNVFIGSGVSSAGKSYALLYDTTAHTIRTAASYYSALPASGETLPITGGWFLDN